MGFRLGKALDAIKLEQEAKIATAVENIRAYENSVGIGEHPDLVGAVKEQVAIVAEAQDILSALKHVEKEIKE